MCAARITPTSERAPAAVASQSASQLEHWSRGHAVLLALGGAVSILTGRMMGLAGLAALSFLRLLWRERVRFGSSAKFGAANWITLLRLGLVLGLASRHEALSLFQCSLVASLVLTLDGLDGFVARKTGTASPFGAHFDMESDALFVLTLSLLLWTRERLGPWIVLGGALRPAYVLWLWLLPAPAGEEPRSRWGRWAFFAFSFGLIAPLATAARWADGFAAFGTLAVSLSFARSGRHWYRARALAQAKSSGRASQP